MVFTTRERIEVTTAASVMSSPSAQEFERMFREHSGFIYRTAYSLTGNAEDAEDVLQTIFLRLLRREFLPDLGKNPKAYLYRAAVNMSLNTIRLRRSHVAIDSEDGVEPSAPASDANLKEEMEERLLDAIAQLDPAAVEILILRYEHDCSDAEIAKLLGTSRGTIAVSLFRTRARLKKLIRASLGDK